MIGIKGMLKGFALVLTVGLVGCATRYPYEIAPPRQSTETCFYRNVCIYGTPQWEMFKLQLGDELLRGFMLNKTFVGRDIQGKYREAVLFRANISDYTSMDSVETLLMVDCPTGDTTQTNTSMYRGGMYESSSISENRPATFISMSNFENYLLKNNKHSAALFTGLLRELKPTICQNYQQYQVVPTDFR